MAQFISYRESVDLVGQLLFLLSLQDEVYAAWTMNKHLPAQEQTHEQKQLGESMSRLWCLVRKCFALPTSTTSSAEFGFGCFRRFLQSQHSDGDNVFLASGFCTSVSPCSKFEHFLQHFHHFPGV